MGKNIELVVSAFFVIVSLPMYLTARRGLKLCNDNATTHPWMSKHFHERFTNHREFAFGVLVVATPWLMSCVAKLVVEYCKT